MNFTIFLLVTKYYSGGQITKNERDGAFGTLGGKWKWLHDFGEKTWRKDSLGKTSVWMGS